MKHKIILLISCFVLYFSAGATDIREILLKVKDAYQSSSTVAFDFTYSYYRTAGATTPLKISRGSAKMRDSLQWVKLDQMEMLKSSGLLIVADHKKKYLMVDSAGSQLNQDYKQVPVDSILKYYGNASAIENERSWIVTVGYSAGHEPLIKSTVLVINKRTFLIEKITINYNTVYGENERERWDPVLVVEYSNISTGISLDDSTFSEGMYVSNVAGNITVKDRYKKYELINHLSK